MVVRQIATVLNRNLLLFSLFSIGVWGATNVPEEYCQFESFNPKCLKNEAILMTSGIYGRMRVGRCLEAGDDVAAFGNDPRYMGCYSDVLPSLDIKCSGKSECEIRIPDPDIERKIPCYTGLKMYLEASYICLNVLDNDRTCSATLSSQSALYIISPSTSKIGCGSKGQPWILEAPVGQRINITLLNFTPSNQTQRLPTDVTASDHCKQPYGYILEKNIRKNTSICGADLQREKQLLFSTTNIVEIILLLVTGQRLQLQASFFLRIEAIGCSDLIPPEDAWLKRNGNKATIGCYSSRQTWELHCLGRQWIGVLGNCSKNNEERAALQTEDSKVAAGSSQEFLIIVSICGFGIVVCFIIICFGFVCLTKYSGKNNQRSVNTSQYNHMKSKKQNDLPQMNGTNYLLEPPIPESGQPLNYSVYGGSDTYRQIENCSNAITSNNVQ